MALKLNSYVLALVSIHDENGEVCAPGDRGRVEWLEPDGVPLVRFERTGNASMVDPDVEVVSTRCRCPAVA